MYSKTSIWLVLIILTPILCTIAILTGPGDLSDPDLTKTFLELRFWRLVASMLGGAALAAGGVIVQGLLRNPLASPSILGVSAGANLGGIIALTLWARLLQGSFISWISPELLLPVGCLLGALSTLLLLLLIIRNDAGVLRTLLTGFIITSLLTSIGSLLTSLAQDSWQLGRAIITFSLGGIDNIGPQHIVLSIPLVIAASIASWLWGKHLDMLLSGEDEAQTLGVNVVQTRRWMIIWTALLLGSATSIGANVQFVGLIIPHAIRPFTGAEHRSLLPPAMIAGGLFLTLADIVTKMAPPGVHIPLSVVTGIIGAPIFLHLLSRASKLGQLS